MPAQELFRLLTALALLLVAAGLMGRLFTRFRQPAVIGEITGGLLLGPTLLGAVAPDIQAWLFPHEGPVGTGLAVVNQMGMLLLMFLAGAEMRTVFSRENIRPVMVIALVGMALPLLCGLLFVAAFDVSGLVGPAADQTALILILTSSLAVTSIPVISRIMLDLGIMRTSFARTVLSVAVLEDVVLNVLLAVALGMVSWTSDQSFGIVAFLDLASSGGAIAYHAAATIGFFALATAAGHLYRRARRSHRAPGGGGSHRVTTYVVLMLGMAACCFLLDITPIFGAFVVGLMIGGGGGGDDGAESIATIRVFSSGFFIPVYFAIVGLKLDLVNGLLPWFALGFIVFACVTKIGSVYLGARLAGKPPVGAVNLAMALNARGGPGIVMATLAYDAGIINLHLFTTLVLTAVLTSLLAGSWLQAVVSRDLLVPAGLDGVDRVARTSGGDLP